MKVRLPDPWAQSLSARKLDYKKCSLLLAYSESETNSAKYNSRILGEVMFRWIIYLDP